MFTQSLVCLHRPWMKYSHCLGWTQVEWKNLQLLPNLHFPRKQYQQTVFFCCIVGNKVENRLIIIDSMFKQLVDYLRMEVSGLRGLPYETLGVLGTGGFADVFKVRYIHTGQLYALKKIKKYRLNDSKIKVQTDRQIDLMKQIDHPNIIKLIDSFTTPDGETLLILELAEGGNLYDKLQQYGSFPQYRVVSYVKDLVSALEYLHNRQEPIIHRDIKPQNLLIDKSDRIKLSDFGSANILDEGGSRVTYAGTMIYMAPEMVMNQPYNTSLDLWNVGLIIYELLTGQNPFQKVDVVRLESMILNTELHFPSYFPVLARDVVKRLLKKNPEDRMTLAQLKNHVWLNIGMQEISLLKNPIDIRKSKKYEQAMTAIDKLKRDLNVKRQQQEQIKLIKEKIKERKKQYQLMALKEPEDNYLQLRQQLYQLRVKMYQNEIKLKNKHERMLRQQEKRKATEQQQKKQIEEYIAKIAKLKQLPIKKHVILKNQLQQAITCMKQLITKMELLPQTIRDDLQYIRQPRVRSSRPAINLDLLKMTVKLMTTQYNALVEKKECLMRNQASHSNKNSEESIHSTRAIDE